MSQDIEDALYREAREREREIVDALRRCRSCVLVIDGLAIPCVVIEAAGNGSTALASCRILVNTSGAPS